MDIQVKSDTDLAAIIASMQTREQCNNGVFTVAQLCYELSMSEKSVRRHLRTLIEGGKAEHVPIVVLSISGQAARGNGYRLVSA